MRETSLPRCAASLKAPPFRRESGYHLLHDTKRMLRATEWTRSAMCKVIPSQ
jgi:hypothetical protein